MDVILLSGGFARRMEPMSLFIPKALLPVNGRPMIDHILEGLKDSSEIGRVIIDTNKKFASQFEYYMANKERSGFGKRLELLVEPTMHNNEKFGSIKAIDYVINYAKVSSDLLIISTDNYYDFSIAKIIEHFKKGGNAAIGVYNLESLEERRKMGMVSMEGERVVELQEKPENPKSSLCSIGIYAFPSSALGMFGRYVAEGNNPDAFGYFVDWYCKRNQTEGVVCTGKWFDIGTLESYKHVYELYDQTE
ncbi:MAG: nucleotidyltransferase family protein [Candidatus Micrarchaeota archaeon]|nr:nucleotidyltransferase family protein [Candidatus Micrarchaeota archaeon]MDE1848038.1 nucleotidyltransferase family protein [Candidatus Micrarchaeota archaeon]MDE1864731.1 nucleotidyltransferase family protein [Candidatus Micrarchaeota archaeon]